MSQTMAADGELVEVVEDNTLELLTRAEIDTQIATAKKYPRSIKEFRREATEMATLDEDIAGECMYALKRSGKTIEGPSARFAEIVASAWGNCRAGARIIAEEDKFVVAQGVFADLQRNVVITYESRRRITTKNGARFNDDMIGVTANAACSIALRNAVFKGIPKAFWKQPYEAARETAIGNAETLTSRRDKMLKAFAQMGADEPTLLSWLEVAGVADITLDHLAVLRGVFTRIKDGEVSVDDAFARHDSEPQKRVKTSDVDEKLKAKPADPPQEETKLASIMDDVGLFDSCKNKTECNALANKLVQKWPGEDERDLIEEACDVRCLQISNIRGAKSNQQELIEKGGPTE